MISHELVGWTTLRGTAPVSSFTQSESERLYCEGFRDVVAWIQVTEVTAAAEFSINLETSPTDDDALFQTLTSTPVTAPGVYLAISRAKSCDVPLASVLRWSVTKKGGGMGVAGSLNFRIVLGLNATVPEFRLVRDGEVWSNPALGGG